MPDHTVHNDRKKHQFILSTEKGSAFIDYSMHNDEVHLLHSEVPRELRGQGIGKVLVEKTFELITADGQQAVAHCGFIKSVAKNSDKWSSLVKLA